QRPSPNNLCVGMMGIRSGVLTYGGNGPFSCGILGIGEAFYVLGSQNLSAVSLQNNRKVGLLVTGSARAHLDTWFDQWWARAMPWS
ncbi:MAG: hypothetical protein OWQ57_11110, partial [Sulfobacillus sp.]|nr:hypothetical protein [Sulfobacillus sp.]